ncbi:hypothetical protein R1flu_012425 [Riccia fluitans]|uniref:AB hydrolase-1 domain-containing protein n=1 Tax=Riccia fluitans TaxID=41844 RepID=A0ABD1ZBQ5_9MARC
MSTGRITTGVLVSILLLSSTSMMVAEPVQRTDDYSSNASLPTWVLVHGTYGGSWIWYKIQGLLEAEGYLVYSVDLTSHGIVEDDRSADSVRTIEDWASPLCNFLSNSTQKVLLVTHSLGGAAASLAMEMYPEKISKAIFVAAAMPANGEVVGDVISNKLQQQVDTGVLSLSYADGSLSMPTSMHMNINLPASRKFFFNRCPDEDFILLRDLLTPFPYRPFMQSLTLTDGNYGSVPRYYIKCGLDNMFSVVTQQKICDNNPPQVQFVLKNGDHAPMFSETPYLFFMLKSIQKYH